MTAPADNERLKECHCGKEPWVSKHANPKPTENIFGDMLPSKPWVSIQCRYGRHNNVLINVNANGDTIEEAERKAVKSWNEFQTLISNKPTLAAHGGLAHFAEYLTSRLDDSGHNDSVLLAADTVKGIVRAIQAQCSQVRTREDLLDIGRKAIYEARNANNGYAPLSGHALAQSVIDALIRAGVVTVK